MHGVDENVLNLLLSHRVDFDLKIFGEAERLDLKILTLADEFINLTHASQSYLLPCFLCKASEPVLAASEEALVVQDYVKGVRRLQRPIGLLPQGLFMG